MPERPGQVFHSAPRSRYTIGRAAGSDVQLDHGSVSRVHLVIFDAGSEWQIEDRLSKNGTRLDGRPVDRAALGPGCWIEAGGIPIRVESEPALQKAEGRDAPSATESPSDTPIPVRLARLLNHVCSISGCDRAGVWATGPDQRFEPLEQLGRARPPVSMAAIESAANDSEVFCSDTAGALARVRSQSVAEGGIRALFALPVRRCCRTQTVLYADSRAPGKLFTERDAELLHTAAEHIALTLDSLRARQRIERLKGEIE